MRERENEAALRADRKRWWQRWNGSQWIDRQGRRWSQDGAGKWWRHGLSTMELFTFQPSRRCPPREFGPYRRAESRAKAGRITDLWVSGEMLP